MTVQELYDLTQKRADRRKVEIRPRPYDDEIAEVELEEQDGKVFACLIEEGAIHLPATVDQVDRNKNRPQPGSLLREPTRRSMNRRSLTAFAPSRT